MSLTELQIKLAIGLLSAAGGSLVSLGTAYFILAKEIAYIKGQLSHLLKFHERLSKLYERQVNLDRDLSNHKKDIDFAHDKIRSLEKVVNG